MSHSFYRFAYHLGAEIEKVLNGHCSVTGLEDGFYIDGNGKCRPHDWDEDDEATRHHTNHFVNWCLRNVNFQKAKRKANFNGNVGWHRLLDVQVEVERHSDEECMENGTFQVLVQCDNVELFMGLATIGEEPPMRHKRPRPDENEHKQRRKMTCLETM